MHLQPMCVQSSSICSCWAEGTGCNSHDWGAAIGVQPAVLHTHAYRPTPGLRHSPDHIHVQVKIRPGADQECWDQNKVVRSSLSQLEF